MHKYVSAVMPCRATLSFSVCTIIYLLLESDVLHFQCSWHTYWPRTSWIQVPVFGMHAICLSNIIMWSFVLTWKPLVVLMTFPDSSVRPHVERAVRRVSNATELCFFSYWWCINTITKNTLDSNVLATTWTLIWQCLHTFFTKYLPVLKDLASVTVMC